MSNKQNDIFYETAKDAEEEREIFCIRCNDNGCPFCDGTKGSKYNPEPF